MATKKAPSKVARQPAKKSAKTSARKSSATGAKKVGAKAGKAIVKTAGRAPKLKSVSIERLKDLRQSFKALSENSKPLSAAEVGDLATEAHTVIETFLKAVGGVGNGQSDTKIRIVGSEH